MFGSITVQSLDKPDARLQSWSQRPQASLRASRCINAGTQCGKCNAAHAMWRVQGGACHAAHAVWWQHQRQLRWRLQEKAAAMATAMTTTTSLQLIPLLMSPWPMMGLAIKGPAKETTADDSAADDAAYSTIASRVADSTAIADALGNNTQDKRSAIACVHPCKRCPHACIVSGTLKFKLLRWQPACWAARLLPGQPPPSPAPPTDAISCPRNPCWDVKLSKRSWPPVCKLWTTSARTL